MDQPLVEGYNDLAELMMMGHRCDRRQSLLDDDSRCGSSIYHVYRGRRLGDCCRCLRLRLCLLFSFGRRTFVRRGGLFRERSLMVLRGAVNGLPVVVVAWKVVLCDSSGYYDLQSHDVDRDLYDQSLRLGDIQGRYHHHLLLRLLQEAYQDHTDQNQTEEVVAVHLHHQMALEHDVED